MSIPLHYKKTMKTYDSINEIYNDLKSTIEHDSDSKVLIDEGALADIFKGLASYLHAVETKNKFIYKNAFSQSADLEHLIFEYNDFVPYKIATQASGLIYLVGTENTIIPKGTVFKDGDNNQYETTALSQIDKYTINKDIILDGDMAYIDISDMNIPTTKLYFNGIEKIGYYENGKLVFTQNGITELDEQGNTIPIQATITVNYSKVDIKKVEAGVSKQKLFDSILTIEEPIAGIDSEARIIIYVQGEDDEDVDSYRDRIQTFKSKPNAPFSINEMESLIYDNIPAVKFLAIKGGEYEPGKVKIYAIDSFYNLDDDTKNEILLNFYNRAPLNIDKANITCVKPTIKNIDVVINNLNPNTDTITNEIKKNITNFFEQGNFFEKNIDKIDLERVIFLSQIGVEKVISFELKEGFLGSEEDTYFKLGDISIT